MDRKQSGDSLPVLIILIVLLLVIAGGGYYLYQKPVNPDQLNSQVISSLSPVSTPAQASEIKEYSNSKFGFKFNYDGDSVVTEKENNVAGSNLVYELQANNPKFDDNKPYLELAINKDPVECPVKSTDLKSLKSSKVTISGKASDLIEGEGAYATYRRSVCLKDDNNNLFWFVSDYPVNSSDDVKLAKNKLFDQILDSFSFTTSSQVDSATLSSEGQSCGKNAGAGGDAKCAPGLSCTYPTQQDETQGIGTCVKPQ